MIPFFMVKKILLYLAVVFPVFVNAQHVTFNANMKAAQQNIVKLQFDELKQRLAEERKMNPANITVDYLEGAATCIELFVNESETDFDEKLLHIEEFIEKIKDLPHEEPYRKLMLGELHLALAILNAKFQNNFRAAFQFYKAYNYLEDNYEDHPSFFPTYVPLGVFYAAIGSLPDDYRSLASLLGFHGDVEEGMEMVKKGYRQTISNEDMAFYKDYFGFIYSYVFSELKPGSNVSPQSLGLDVASSGFHIYLQSRIYLAQGEIDKAIELLKNRPKGKEYLPFFYLDYLTGKIAITRDLEFARKNFESYLKNTQSQNYLKSTYRYLSWYHLIKGNQSKLEENTDKIFKEGITFVGADRQALAEAKRGFNRVLVKARLKFDAGEFKQTLSWLNSNPLKECCPANHEKVEYYYRKGRAYQELKQWDNALAELKKALTFKEVETSYALGNSALQAAYIYEQTGQLENAEEYYKKTLKYKDYPFYEGIHQKAKAGLNRIK